MTLVDILKQYGVGRRTLDNPLFSDDKPPCRLGIRDAVEEDVCKRVVKKTIPCHIPSCGYQAESLLDFESHYNSLHRYACKECKKVLPTPFFLDLHIQEKHDSFFAVMSAKKPSYSCYIEECKEKFNNADERFDHCVKIHKLPKDFRFDLKIETKKGKGKKKEDEMDMDGSAGTSETREKFSFTNKKNRTFTKYSGKKFTKDTTDVDDSSKFADVNMDDVVKDLKDSLPQ